MKANRFGRLTFLSFDEEFSLLNPDLNLACVRAEVGPLEGGNLELKNLAVELAGRHEGELGQGRDSRVKDKS